jgi:hypothetical protein
MNIDEGTSQPGQIYNWVHLIALEIRMNTYTSMYAAKGPFTRWDVLYDIPWNNPWYLACPTESPWDFSRK